MHQSMTVLMGHHPMGTQRDIGLQDHKPQAACPGRLEQLLQAVRPAGFSQAQEGPLAHLQLLLSLTHEAQVSLKLIFS